MDITTSKLINSRFEQQYFYPFDQYDLVTTFIAFNTAANTSLPVVRLAFSDPANNFHPKMNESETQTFVNNTLMSSSTTSVSIQRSISLQVFVGLLFSLTWILTIAVMYITVIVLFGSTRKLGDSVTLLPMAMILTLPNLRQIFANAPPFGELSSNFFC